MIKWTQQELDDLKMMYEDHNCSLEFMVKHLGRTDNAIRLKASRLGISRPIPMYFISGDFHGITYDPLSHTMMIIEPVDIDQVLTAIHKIKDDWKL